MLKQLKPALVLFLLLTISTGVIYPLLVTALAQGIFSSQANGSLVYIEGTPVGSRLIGQNFSQPKYFWPRPSTTASWPYNAFDPTAPSGSSGSNLGPLSQSLFDNVQGRAQALQTAHPQAGAPVPVGLVTASASGLDPHISLAAAYYQVQRVAQARGLEEQFVRRLVDAQVEPRQLGLLGEERINVLLLNLALDAADPQAQ